MSATATAMPDSPTQATRYRVAICGAGPVGMACAALLARGGIAPASIALIDGKPLAQVLDDPRSIALSWGSRLLFGQLGAWPIAATAIHQIHVSRAGRFGRTLIDRKEQGVEALGYVADYGAIVAALARACDAAGITSLRPLQLGRCEERDDHVRLGVRDAAGHETQIEADIVIQAEGGVFAGQPPRELRRDYHQTALIARIASPAAPDFRAYERFTDDGPLALLPQQVHPAAAGSQYALVWCVQPEQAPALLALDDATFLQRLQQAFGDRLGRFSAVSARAAFALGLNAHQPGTARTVAIGNAAQTLHPVAGQGMNLGLRDACVLARLLAQHEEGTAALAEFEGARARDRALTIRLTDSLARVFTRSAGGAAVQTLLGLSLGLLDVAPSAKNALAGLMMFGYRE